ncbi:hypothetical protein [Sorangium sp. So ce1024]|uniref:hypothetical protein n=1 Tax=Sorangium sp. So ce1024 TaxID=3133327 RepID=UPI003EFF3180
MQERAPALRTNLLLGAGTRAGDGTSPPINFGARLLMSSAGGKSFFKLASDMPIRTPAFGAGRFGTAGGATAKHVPTRSWGPAEAHPLLLLAADDAAALEIEPHDRHTSLMTSTVSRSPSSAACSGLPRSSLPNSLHLACGSVETNPGREAELEQHLDLQGVAVARRRAREREVAGLVRRARPDGHHRKLHVGAGRRGRLEDDAVLGTPRPRKEATGDAVPLVVAVDVLVAPEGVASASRTT